MAGAVPDYSGAAAVITALGLLGQVLELHARGRTSAALRDLLDLAPPTARRLAPGELAAAHAAPGSETTGVAAAAGTTATEVPLAAAQPGHRLRVRPGATAPAD